MNTAGKLARLLVLGIFILVVAVGASPASEEAKAKSAASLADISFSFKLDNSLTRGMYLGDRWVSPSTFSAYQGGKEITVEVKAEGKGAGGEPVAISPKWVPADPDSVSVSPQLGRQVKLTVKRAGRSSLMVASPGCSRELSIDAYYDNNAMRVDISR